LARQCPGTMILRFGSWPTRGFGVILRLLARVNLQVTGAQRQLWFHLSTTGRCRTRVMVRPLTVTWRHVCVHDSNVQVLRMTSTWLWCHHPKTAVRVMVCTQAVTQRELSRFLRSHSISFKFMSMSWTRWCRTQVARAGLRCQP
jgi:hypothetical protein